jgi:hypothetical protein
MMSADQTEQAMARIGDEERLLKGIARICFDETLGRSPERYLRPGFQQSGASLKLMADVYKQAQRLGIIDEPQIEDANAMFEYVWPRLHRRGGYGGWLFGRKVEDEMRGLRYLLACLEETARVEGLKLMIQEVNEEGLKLGASDETQGMEAAT